MSVVWRRIGKNSTNINFVNFDQKNQSIKFSFDTPDQPFYKVTKILKTKPNEYEVYFQDKNMGSNFNFDVTLKIMVFQSGFSCSQ